MNYNSRFLSGEEFFTLTGIRLENELNISSTDNPSNIVENTLARVERILENYVGSDFYNNLENRFSTFTDKQKELWKLAVAEQTLYMLKNGDLTLDSGYTKEKGNITNREQMRKITYSEEAIKYLTRLGLRCTHLGINNDYGNGMIVGFLDL